VLSLIYPPDGEALGYDSPWLFFNQKIFFDKAGLSVWTGVNGHGKTQFLNHLACYWMSKGAKVCISSLEIEAAETLQNLINVLSCKNTNPRLDNKISQEYALSCMDWLNNDRLWLYDEFGGANAKELLNVLQYAHRKYGIDIFVIDSLSLINIDDDDYNSQSNFVRELVRFKKQNNCHVHLVVHPRKGTDENKLVGKFDFKGSGTITNLADNCFSITRNKAKELAKYCQEIGELLDEEDIGALSEKDAFVWCMKQRKGGHEGKFGFVVDLMAKRYKSCESERLVPYVEYFSGKKIT
jgi:twinkle protein